MKVEVVLWVLLSMHYYVLSVYCYDYAYLVVCIVLVVLALLL